MNEGVRPRAEGTGVLPSVVTVLISNEIAYVKKNVLRKMVTCDLKIRAGRLRRPAASAHRDAVNTPFADGATCFATLVEITFFSTLQRGV